MVPFRLAAVGLIAQLGQSIFIVFQRGLSLFQEFGDMALLALLDGLFLG